MAAQVASIFGVISLNDSGFKTGIAGAEKSMSGFGGKLKSMADSITQTGAKLSVLGGAISTLVSPLVDFGTASLTAFTDFDESMKNIQAVAGYTDTDIVKISASVREIGTASRFGPQAAADAFYEVAGGVSDASARMAVFEQAVKTASAGNADLTATTSALISVTNAYGLTAGEVAGASDVLTRIVGTGVGSMDEFAAALPKATTMAASLSIPLKDVGAQMAYLTTKGFTASEASTQLSAMMTTLLSPTKEVAAAIKDAGYESGEAMIKAKGLSGAYDTLKTVNGGSLNGLITNTEALRGATVLATDAFKEFNGIFGNFSTTITSTSNANASGFMAGFEGDKITSISHGLEGATDAAQAIQMSSAAAQFDLLTSSVDGLKLSVGQSLTPALVELTQNTLVPLVKGIMDWVQANPQATITIMMLVGGLAFLATALTVAGTAITAIGVALGVMMSPIGLAILAVGLLTAAYFTNFGGIKDFIDGTVRPIIDKFFELLKGAWDAISPALTSINDWFVTSGLPKVIQIVKDATDAAKKLIDGLKGWWDSVKGGVGAFADGIMKALQPVVDFIAGIATAITNVVNALSGVETTVKAGGNPNAAAANWAASHGGGKAAGGPVMGGTPYTVGEQGREVFVPQTNGTIIPNNQLGGGGMQIGTVVIQANDAAGGRAAADSFDQRLRELQAARG